MEGVGVLHETENLLKNENICPFCSSETKKILPGRPDYECALPIKFDYIQCLNPKCGHVSAKVPERFDLSTLYGEYSTHRETTPQNLSIFTYLIPKEMCHFDSDWETLFIGQDLASKSVLDFGCGNGNFLRKLKAFGIGNVYGYDFDSKAMEVAKNAGCEVLSSLATDVKFDVIFLNHVIEHLSEPLKELERLKLLLNEDGIIYASTPNTGSLTRKVFKDNWRGWETPRHVNVFCVNSACKLIELSSFSSLKSQVMTKNSMFLGIYNESFVGRFWATGLGKVVRWSMLLPFSWGAYLIAMFSRKCGEEVVMVFRQE
ncbi:class I SAM-dependent methyltransferase [Vibrio fluvialis]|nr:class I SAM-dependent methyltransferase [Vibrio fluvialis]MBY8176841.1 class I SAM-dependent methyltransferase [Vibrio fluvialis]MBY8196987.1 class I SAM-dependent methyltransferase [Vibrio fluvialis]MBY8308733.1 class I SAM-dependent methyltransferase [Vibrio fluvialis]